MRWERGGRSTGGQWAAFRAGGGSSAGGCVTGAKPGGRGWSQRCATNYQQDLVLLMTAESPLLSKVLTSRLPQPKRCERRCSAGGFLFQNESKISRK